MALFASNSEAKSAPPITCTVLPASISGWCSSLNGIWPAQITIVSTSKILASFEGFVYDLNPSVYSFDLTISGQTPLSVSGSKLDANAKAAVNSAPRKSTITIDNIRVRVQGVSVLIPEADPIIIQLTN